MTEAGTAMGRFRGRMPAVTVAIALVVVLAACDWPMLGYGANHTRYNPTETAIGVGNVANLKTAWTGVINSGGPTGNSFFSSPSVAGGVVYMGSVDYKLYAFAATGATGCSGTPKACVPLWTATTGSFVLSASVVKGVVYVVSDDGKLYAFDAAGVTKCSGSPKTCAPLWTGVTGSPIGSISSEPTVVNGVVYVGSNDSKLRAFDAAGVTNCSGTPKTCAPIWVGSTGDIIGQSPAVANGVVYASNDSKLYAFDANGVTNCAGTPKTCAPLWTAGTGDSTTSPSVVNGVVYVGTRASVGINALGVAAFDAAGTRNCAGIPKTCSPLWTGITGGSVGSTSSSPAVANGVVYIGRGDGKMYAFDAAGGPNCFGIWCAPLWSTTTGTTGSLTLSSPTVANGVVYVDSQDSKLYAFDAAGTTSCSGTSPRKTCTSLWTATTGGEAVSSPTVANGVVYIGRDDGKLQAFDLPPA